MRRTAMQRLGLLLLLGAIGVTLLPGGAAAQTPSRIGWWYKLNQGGLAGFGVPIPKPDKAPDDGLYVALDPGGEPRAVAALEFIVEVGGDATMTLYASPSSSFIGTTISACPATAAWSQAIQGAWEERPQYDCTLAEVAGKPSEDGKTMAWAFTPNILANPTTYNVVLVPTGLIPFDIGVEKPGDDALTVPMPPSSEPEPAPVPAPEPAPYVAPPALVPYVQPAAPELDLAIPEETPPPTLPSRPVALPKPGPQPMDRMIAMAALAALALALLAASMRRPAEVASGAGKGLQVGGVGRFARPREAKPVRL